MGSAASGLYPAVMDGQFVVPAEDATGHVSRRRIDLDAHLSDGDRVREMGRSSTIEVHPIFSEAPHFEELHTSPEN